MAKVKKNAKGITLKIKPQVVLSKETIQKMEEDIFVIQGYLTLLKCVFNCGSNFEEIIPNTLYITDVAADRTERLVKALGSLPMDCDLVKA